MKVLCASFGWLHQTGERLASARTVPCIRLAATQSVTTITRFGEETATDVRSSAPEAWVQHIMP